MTANKPMTSEQLDELMTVAVNMQRDSEKADDRPAAMFAYAVQVAVLELRKVRNHAAKIPETSMSIARYWISPNGIACEDNEGKFVKYEDHAALEARYLEMAAENARCKFEVSRCHQTVNEMFKNREKWIDKEWLSSIWSTSKRLMEENPATDVFMAEVRAQGVEMCSAEIQKQVWDEREGDGMVAAIDAMEIYAAQLRKGVQS